MNDRNRQNTTLAWARWALSMPADWRPLEILGGLDKGRILVGDADSAVLQVKWTRQFLPERFDVERWVSGRKGARRPNDAAKSAAPSPHGFVVLDWRPEAKAAKGMTRLIWAGWAKKPGLIVEAVAFTQDRPDVARRARVEVLPSLRTMPVGKPVGWAIFEASFRTAPGFDIVEKRFQPGSMAALFESATDRLTLRQAYPIEAALGRRDLAGWLRAEPFRPQRRRFYPVGDPEPWTVHSFGRELTGLIRMGRRKLPSPLGWARPRYTVQAAVEDDRLGRLLLAEHSSVQDVGDEVVREAISQMNWAILE